MTWSKIVSTLIGAGVAGVLTAGGYTIKVEVLQAQSDHQSKLVGAMASSCAAVKPAEEEGP